MLLKIVIFINLIFFFIRFLQAKREKEDHAEAGTSASALERDCLNVAERATNNSNIEKVLVNFTVPSTADNFAQTNDGGVHEQENSSYQVEDWSGLGINQYGSSYPHDVNHPNNMIDAEMVANPDNWIAVENNEVHDSSLSGNVAIDGMNNAFNVADEQLYASYRV